jgi:CDP-diacylglycerol pyrophosphatase
VDTPIGLGINSQANRQADQLHIHMAETRGLSRTDLINQDAAAATTSTGWPNSRVSIRGYSATQGQYIPHVYRVLILQTFGNTNLFTRLRNMVTQQQMKYQTLIVIPRPSGLGGGYYIVNSQLSLRDPAHTNLVGSNTCDPLLQLA